MTFIIRLMIIKTLVFINVFISNYKEKIDSIEEHENFNKAIPFPHIVIDNFFENQFAEALSKSSQIMNLIF